MRKPELLVPASSLEVLKVAVIFGADAVYIGGEVFGLRAKAKNFSMEDMKEGVEFAHQHGVKVYVTANILAHNQDLEGVRAYFAELKEIGPDALIISDPGVYRIAMEVCPEIERHISTQANNTNYGTYQFWYEQGAKRVVTARELSLEEIREIREHIPDEMEIETFVHGASCMAYSGRCLLSAAMAGRSGNQGECAQPCRWHYSVVEEKRPGEYMPVCEDENGTYIFSAHDLNLMPLLPELVDAGIKSLKIEGRMKTAYYVATVTAAYRRALDLLADGGDFAAALPGLMAELSCASHRDSDTGFALGKPEAPGGADGFHQEREYLAHVVEGSRDGRGTRFLLKNRFKAGETIELLTPSGVHAFEATPFLREKTGEIVDTLGIGGEIIRMDVPFATETGDFLRGETRNHRK